MKRRSENVCRQQPAFISASSEEMFARRNDEWRLDEQTTKAFERTRLSNNADGRRGVRFAAGVKPRIGEKALAHARPRVAGCCAERSECQCFRQCVGCRNRT